MKLAFVSETATGRLDDRAREILRITEGTRVVLLAPEIMSGPRASTAAGVQIRRLLVAMKYQHVYGSSCWQLRNITDLDALKAAIIEEGVALNSYPHPAGPQATSIVIVADTPRLWRLAERFGLEVDPAALVNVIDVDLQPVR